MYPELNANQPQRELGADVSSRGLSAFPYAAFLRGINVGGRKPIKMDAWREAFEAMGFQKVKTLLASGNVLFDSNATKAEPTAEKIEERLRNTFGHEIGVLVRPVAELQKLVAMNPFKKVKLTPETRLYVTFLSEKPTPGQEAKLKTAGKDFKFLRVSDREVCSGITISPQRHTTDLMAQLEKELGRKVTTRNWNTVVRVLDAVASGSAISQRGIKPEHRKMANQS